MISPAGKAEAVQIKEQFFYISQDPVNENDLEFPSVKYEFPDKTSVLIGRERYQIPEILFNPKSFEKMSKGIHELVFDSTMKCDYSVRTELASKVCLSGGSTFLPGLTARLHSELKHLEISSPHSKFLQGLRTEKPITNLLGKIPSELGNQICGLQFDIKAKPERGIASWKGGSILSAVNSMKWYERADYDEFGDIDVFQGKK